MFKELFESSKLKDVMKVYKKNGEVHITMGKTDTWANIDDIEGDIGYGIDQFDKDIKINFKKDSFTIVEGIRNEPLVHEIKTLLTKNKYRDITVKFRNGGNAMVDTLSNGLLYDEDGQSYDVDDVTKIISKRK